MREWYTCVNMGDRLLMFTQVYHSRTFTQLSLSIIFLCIPLLLQKRINYLSQVILFLDNKILTTRHCTCSFVTRPEQSAAQVPWTYSLHLWYNFYSCRWGYHCTPFCQKQKKKNGLVCNNFSGFWSYSISNVSFTEETGA